jgi:prepilin-type N-terminal cleavage/methylation domain-containing protein
MRRGFSFFELIIAMAILAILSSVVVGLINPPRLYAKSRNTERLSHVNTILNAVGENMADNRGAFNCAAGSLPTSSVKMATSTYNIAPCLVAAYLPSMPFDPSVAGAHYSSTTDYDTGYTILRSASSGRITVAAPSAELGEVISVTR